MWHLLPKSALFIQQYFSLKRVSSDPEGQSRTGMPRDDLSCAAQTRQRQLRRLKSTVISGNLSLMKHRSQSRRENTSGVLRAANRQYKPNKTTSRLRVEGRSGLGKQNMAK